MPRRLAFVALLAAFTACTDQRATTDQVSSASEDTIRVPSDGEGKWGPIHDAVEVLRTSDGTREATFGRIAFLAATRDGGVIAFDYKAAEGPIVRRFDSNGKFLHNIGRAGGGPGEYNTDVLMIAEQPNGVVLIRDHMRAVNRHAPDGRFISDFALQSGGGYAGIVGAADNSIYVPATYGRDAVMPGGRTPIIHYDSTGQILDTIQPGPAWLPDGSMPQGHAALHPSSFRPQEYWLVLSDGRTVIARTDKLAILIRDTKRGSAILVERQFDPVPYLADERAEWLNAEQRGSHGTEVPPNEVPPNKLPVTYLQADPDDRIWLSLASRSVKTERRCVRSIDGRCTAYVSFGERPVRAAFQPDGEYLGAVRFPVGATHITTAGQFAWAVVHDENDAPVLAKFRLY